MALKFGIGPGGSLSKRTGLMTKLSPSRTSCMSASFPVYYGYPQQVCGIINKRMLSVPPNNLDCYG